MRAGPCRSVLPAPPACAPTCAHPRRLAHAARAGKALELGRHVSKATLPARLAAALRACPQLVSSAVEAFYFRQADPSLAGRGLPQPAWPKALPLGLGQLACAAADGEHAKALRSAKAACCCALGVLHRDGDDMKAAARMKHFPPSEPRATVLMATNR